MITLNINELKGRIATNLSDQLLKDGFIYKKNMNEFKCTKGDYTYIFRLEIIAYSGKYFINVQLYISHKQIENILEKIVGKSRHKLTLGQDIDRIYSSPDGRKVNNNGNLGIWLYNDEEIGFTIELLHSYFNEIAIHYFAKYRTLEAIDDIINNEPFSYCPAEVGGNFYERCMKGLIVAKLIGNSNYEKLEKIYDREMITTMNPEFIESYNKVKEYLIYNRIIL